MESLTEEEIFIQNLPSMINIDVMFWAESNGIETRQLYSVDQVLKGLDAQEPSDFEYFGDIEGIVMYYVLRKDKRQRHQKILSLNLGKCYSPKTNRIIPYIGTPRSEISPEKEKQPQNNEGGFSMMCNQYIANRSPNKKEEQSGETSLRKDTPHRDSSFKKMASSSTFKKLSGFTGQNIDPSPRNGKSPRSNAPIITKINPSPRNKDFTPKSSISQFYDTVKLNDTPKHVDTSQVIETPKHCDISQNSSKNEEAVGKFDHVGEYPVIIEPYTSNLSSNINTPTNKKTPRNINNDAILYSNDLPSTKREIKPPPSPKANLNLTSPKRKLSLVSNHVKSLSIISTDVVAIEPYKGPPIPIFKKKSTFALPTISKRVLMQLGEINIESPIRSMSEEGNPINNRSPLLSPMCDMGKLPTSMMEMYNTEYAKFPSTQFENIALSTVTSMPLSPKYESLNKKKKKKSLCKTMAIKKTFTYNKRKPLPLEDDYVTKAHTGKGVIYKRMDRVLEEAKMLMGGAKCVKNVRLPTLKKSQNPYSLENSNKILEACFNIKLEAGQRKYRVRRLPLKATHY